jgi:hypothetical protein
MCCLVSEVSKDKIRCVSSFPIGYYSSLAGQGFFPCAHSHILEFAALLRGPVDLRNKRTRTSYFFPFEMHLKTFAKTN